MSKFTLIVTPDDADPSAETFETLAEAVDKGAKILCWAGWSHETATECLGNGDNCCLDDAGSVQIIESK